jgi:hypothetical protein
LVLGELRLRCSEEFGFHGLAADEVFDLAFIAIENDVIAGILALFAAELGEERGETVVIIHRPAIERMIVALGALDAHAEKGLGGVLGDLQVSS